MMDGMDDPVILLGFDKDTGHVKACGLHPTESFAREEIAGKRVPDDLTYCLYTPRLGETLPLCIAQRFGAKAL